MIDSSMIERFAQESPTSLMFQGLMEYLFGPENLDALLRCDRPTAEVSLHLWPLECDRPSS